MTQEIQDLLFILTQFLLLLIWVLKYYLKIILVQVSTLQMQISSIKVLQKLPEMNASKNLI